MITITQAGRRRLKAEERTRGKSDDADADLPPTFRRLRAAERARKALDVAAADFLDTLARVDRDLAAEFRSRGLGRLVVFAEHYTLPEARSYGRHLGVGSAFVRLIEAVRRWRVAFEAARSPRGSAIDDDGRFKRSATAPRLLLTGPESS